MAAAKIVPAPLTRPLSDIAREIEADYERRGKPIYFAAVPYVNALFFVNDFTSVYYHDTAEDIVIRLLGNLSTWRGETATRVKTELRAALAWHQADVVRRQVISLMPHRR
jgi:hypothetical protein